jgi:hypothetical protein
MPNIAMWFAKFFMSDAKLLYPSLGKEKYYEN